MFIQYKNVRIYNPESGALADLGYDETEIAEIMQEVEACQQAQPSSASV